LRYALANALRNSFAALGFEGLSDSSIGSAGSGLISLNLILQSTLLQTAKAKEAQKQAHEET
jgi:hypothetical protein